MTRIIILALFVASLATLASARGLWGAGGLDSFDEILFRNAPIDRIIRRVQYLNGVRNCEIASPANGVNFRESRRVAYYYFEDLLLRCELGRAPNARAVFFEVDYLTYAKCKRGSRKSVRIGRIEEVEGPATPTNPTNPTNPTDPTTPVGQCCVQFSYTLEGQGLQLQQHCAPSGVRRQLDFPNQAVNDEITVSFTNAIEEVEVSGELCAASESIDFVRANSGDELSALLFGLDDQNIVCVIVTC